MLKNRLYVPKNTKERDMARTLLICGIAIFFAAVVLTVLTHLDRQDRETFTNTHLCEVEEPCMLRLNITYDIEPIEVMLISPSHKRYAEEDLTIRTMDEHNTEVLFRAEETGLWDIEYTKKRNNSLSLQVNFDQLDDMTIKDVRLDKTDQTIWLWFTPSYAPDVDPATEIYATVTFEQSQKRTTLFDGGVLINQPAQIQYDTTEMPDGTYKLTITTWSDPQAEHDPFEAHYEESSIEYIRGGTESE